MKRLPIRGGAALAVCVSALALAAGPAAAASSGGRVSITDSGFRPAAVTIKQWQVVTWTNRGTSEHGVTSNTGSALDSGPFVPGQAYANLFTTAGTFAYHDPAHPGLTGRVVVVAAPKPTVTGAKPPSGKKPKGFHPKASRSTSGTDTLTERDTRTNWTVAGIGLGVAAVLIAAVAFLLLRRRRRPAG